MAANIIETLRKEEADRLAAELAAAEKARLEEEARRKQQEEAALADPAAPFDQFLVHDGNLPRRSAEADEAELQPIEKGLAEARMRWTVLRDGCTHWSSLVLRVAG